MCKYDVTVIIFLSCYLESGIQKVEWSSNHRLPAATIQNMKRKIIKKCLDYETVVIDKLTHSFMYSTMPSAVLLKAEPALYFSAPSSK